MSPISSPYLCIFGGLDEAIGNHPGSNPHVFGEFGHQYLCTHGGYYLFSYWRRTSTTFHLLSTTSGDDGCPETSALNWPDGHSRDAIDAQAKPAFLLLDLFKCCSKRESRKRERPLLLAVALSSPLIIFMPKESRPAIDDMFMTGGWRDVSLLMTRYYGHSAHYRHSYPADVAIWSH